MVSVILSAIYCIPWSRVDCFNQISTLLIWVRPYTYSPTHQVASDIFLSVNWVVIPSLPLSIWAYGFTQSYPYLASCYGHVRCMSKWTGFHVHIIMNSGLRIKWNLLRKVYDIETMWLFLGWIYPVPCHRHVPMFLTNHIVTEHASLWFYSFPRLEQTWDQIYN